MMPKRWIATVFVAVLVQLVRADWTFKSRPDLSPPTLNITIPVSSDISPGYIFISPRSSRRVKAVEPHGPVQAGPYIFKSTGELVWSGVGSFLASTSNFQAAKLHGEDVLFGFESDAASWRPQNSQGHAKILNRKYELVQVMQATNQIVADKHEFRILNEKTALFVSYTPVPHDLRSFGTSPKAQWLFDGVFQEVDIKTGGLVFEWRSLNHVFPDECVVPLSSLSLGSGFNSTDAIDYFHMNAVDGDGKDYLVSGRRTSTIYKINGTNGDIIWRLGGKYSNFTFGPGAQFGLQHDARFLSRSQDGHTEVISLFDNSGEQLMGKHGQYEHKSSGKILSLNIKDWTANLVQKFQAPNGEFAFAMGNTQVLPNGNVLVNWGTAGAITEFAPNGTAVFHTHLDSGELFRNGRPASYRAFKFNWTGLPTEDPVIVALKHGESTMVYVSWNGDTETKAWRFYGIDGKGKEELLGEEERTGFETGFYVKSEQKWTAFLAKAVGSDAKLLRISKVVKPKPYIYQYVPGRDDLTSGANGSSQALTESRKSEL